MRVAVIGSRGLVGDALCRNLQEDIIEINRDNCNILDTKHLRDFLYREKIDVAINCAACVGGIHLNRKRPYTMFRLNLELNQSVLNACIRSDTNKLVQFCSNCAYPREAIQPYKEIDLFNGQSANTNQGYAAAKIAGLQAGIAAHSEYGIDVYHPIPCSLFGYRDNYNINNSHFVAAAIRKIHEAVKYRESSILFWGTGKPCREILFADELANAIKKILEANLANEPVNIATGIDTPIIKIIEIISTIAGYKGEIRWDKSKPDGALHKLLNNTKMKELNWEPQKNLEESLRKTFVHYQKGMDIRL